MTDTELRRRIIALEMAVDRLMVEVSELKARPQSASIGGAGGGTYWPWPTMGLSAYAGAVGSTENPATSAGANGGTEQVWD